MREEEKKRDESRQMEYTQHRPLRKDWTRPTNNSETMQTQGLTHYRQLFLLLAFLSLVLPEVSSSESSESLLNPSEDYSDPYAHISTDSPGLTSPDSIPEPCYKDLCQDLPAPCAELAAMSRCSCPGVSMGPSAHPEAPVVKIYWREGTEPEVRWCAAHADENVYRVLVQGKEVGEFGELKRSTVVKGLSAGAEVCVQAVNDVGQSALEGRACEVYKPPKGSPSLALKVGLIGGALGLLLLISLAALLWRHRSRRKDGARVSTEGPL